MTSGPLRRSQLISPFGPGAMHVLPNGTGVVTAGLDYWFRRPENLDEDRIDQEAFRVDEWRLSHRLGTNEFFLPPDYRYAKNAPEGAKNLLLTIPCLRFPRWHYCPRCHLMVQFDFHTAETEPCRSCADHGKKVHPIQVPFVAVCDAGHLFDFPWREWLFHKNTLTQTHLDTEIYLKSRGGTTLYDLYVCTAGEEDKRELGLILNDNGDGNIDNSHLTAHLSDDGTPHLCPGIKSWLSGEADVSCGRPVRGALRNSLNVYFPRMATSIFLPSRAVAKQNFSDRVNRILELFDAENLLRNIRDTRPENPWTASDLRQTLQTMGTMIAGSGELQSFTDDELNDALRFFWNNRGTLVQNNFKGTETSMDDIEFRRQEYDVFLEVSESDRLCVSIENVTPPFNELISRISLISKLRETRVLSGFTRIYTDPPQRGNPPVNRQRLLRETDSKDSWLPAYVVHGEGVFIQLNLERVQEWERRPGVQNRVSILNTNFQNFLAGRNAVTGRVITPRFMLVHTLAHLLMNRLTFECGYSTASIRERLYIQPGESGMAALLLYTAAGDAEGTMGGLVRMGKSQRFNPLLMQALEHAQWCSADPVCMEIAMQGMNSLNGAACHGCCLVPETSCEEFNNFLDRALIVGSFEEPELGFFKFT